MLFKSSVESFKDFRPKADSMLILTVCIEMLMILIDTLYLIQHVKESIVHQFYMTNSNHHDFLFICLLFRCNFKGIHIFQIVIVGV